jgi:hypothetical protein
MFIPTSKQVSDINIGNDEKREKAMLKLKG